jgi:hypothetical protein
LASVAEPKEHILADIRRLAVADGGIPPGVQAFQRATGIKESVWRGRYWVNWGQALMEAGYAPNSWVQEIPEHELLGKLAVLVSELGHYPVNSELALRRRNDPDIPSVKTLSTRYGSAQATADALLRYARKEGDAALAAICEARIAAETPRPKQIREKGETVGCVYLMKSGPFYKIGLSNSAGRREYELGIQLPEKPKLVHEIMTDCPAALETYWHNRFSSRRKNGEWFELDAAAIKSFTKRKQFLFGDVFS